MRGFLSDNAAGVHPAVLSAIIAEAQDPSDKQVQARWTATVASLFGTDAASTAVVNGTGANVVGLSSVMPAGGVVLASAAAHIHRSEGGALERIGRLKIIPIPSRSGKLAPAELDMYSDRVKPQPGAVSITQSTEVGTIYSRAEITEIAAWAHERGLLVHMDGARLPNAAAASGTTLRELSTDCGVDVLSLGGTKHGALAVEAVITIGQAARGPVQQLQSAMMQRPPKMRFALAQLVALYEGDLWRRNGEHSNAMAARLRTGLEGVAGTRFAHPTECNAVFAKLNPRAMDRLVDHFSVNTRSAVGGYTRLMCSWDTTETDVDTLVSLAGG